MCKHIVMFCFINYKNKFYFNMLQVIFFLTFRKANILVRYFNFIKYIFFLSPGVQKESSFATSDLVSTL